MQCFWMRGVDSVKIFFYEEPSGYTYHSEEEWGRSFYRADLATVSKFCAWCHVLRTDPVLVYIYSLDPSIAP
jgi:hypothetical protein